MAGLFRPWVLLAVMVALACAAVAVGIRLGHGVVVEPGDRDEAGDDQFAQTVQRELDRLEHLYEARLRNVAGAAVASGSGLEVRRLGRGLEGLVSLTVFQASSRSQLIEVLPGNRSPRPVIAPADVEPGETTLVVLPMAGLADAEWTDSPGAGLFFTLKPDEAGPTVVATVDRLRVAGAIDRWVRDVWLAEQAVHPVGGAGRWELASASGGLLAAGGLEKLPSGSGPGFVRALHTRFGSWRFASWAPVVTKTAYDVSAIAGSVGAAIFLTAIGAGLFFHQRELLRDADRRVSFANRVSHELRTPLTNMLLNLDLVADAMDERAPGSLRRRLDLVREEGERLSRLVSNALAYSSRSQTRAPRPLTWCDPTEIVRATAVGFGPALERRGIRLRLLGNACGGAEIDRDALAQIVANLLSNIEKYAGENAEAEVETNRTPGRFTVEVRDTGPGISGRDRRRAFEPFERLHDRIDEGATGAGLGLAISRDLAESMGGTLELLPATRGAAFRLTFPTAVPGEVGDPT